MLGAASALALTEDFENFGITADAFETGPTPNAVVTETPDPFGPDSGLQITGNGLWQDSTVVGFRNVYNEVQNPVGTFAYDYWSGVGLSTVEDTTTPGFANEGASFAGGGADFAGATVPGGAYGVVFPFFSGVGVITQNLEYALQGMHITNTTYAGLAMQEGTPPSRQFAQGDWFQLTITGLDTEGGVTGERFVFLADFRSSDPADHYILNTWEWVDLSDFGPDTADIRFSFYSSDNGDFGINTPTYVAIDNLTYTAKALAGSQPVSNGWSYSPWFGNYYDAEYPWIYHEDLGWFYLAPESTPDALYFYWNDYDWFYTSKDLYPWLYFTTLGNWFYYIKDTVDPWLFYDATNDDIARFFPSIDI